MSSAKLVQLDLNNPAFQESWFELLADEAERVRTTLKKTSNSRGNRFIRSIFEYQVANSKGKPQCLTMLMAQEPCRIHQLI